MGALLSVVWAVQEFKRDRLGDGAYALGFGAIILLFYFCVKRREDKIQKPPVEFQFYEVYGFFGGWVIVGVTAFALAVLGVTPAGIVIGAAGLLVAVGSVYAIARESQNIRRQHEEASTKTNVTSEITGN